jgi:hypothetical protein
MESKLIKTPAGSEYKFTRTTNDGNGNPRYIVSWLALGLPAYQANDKTRRAGLRKYSGKAFGGGFVFQSYNLERSAEFFESLGLYRLRV